MASRRPAVEDAALVLFRQLSRAQQELMLRQMWRLIPLSRRKHPKLTAARPFAPAPIDSARASKVVA